MPKKCKDTEVDIAVLDNRVKSVEHFVEEMTTNHLPHLYQGINDLKLKMAYWAGGATVSIIIAQILIQIYI